MSNLRSRLEGTPAPAPVPAAALSQDPDKLLEAAVPAVEPVVAPVVEPAIVAPVLKRYEYQPKDEQGRSLGGKQVIEYTDEADLQTKWAAKEELLVRRLREVTRKQKLGITDEAALPDGTELAAFEQPKPRVLSAEERFQLSQDMNDPEKSVDAVNTLIEASIGYTAAQMRQQFDEARLAKLQHQAVVNYRVFEQKTPEFYVCTDNAQILTDWMFSKKLAPTVKNYELAFSTLRGAGLLQDAPTVREVTPPAEPAAVAVVPAAVSTEPKPVVPAVTDGRIANPEPPQQTRQVARVPSGLNGRTSADSGTPSVGTSLTLAEFDKIPADELKRKLKDPVFAKLVNELFAPKKPA